MYGRRFNVEYIILHGGRLAFGHSMNPRKKYSHREFTSIRMQPRPHNVAQGEKGDGDEDPVSLASFEHRLRLLPVERDGGNNVAPLFAGNPGEGLSVNQLAPA